MLKRLLLVDDDHRARESLSVLLQATGHEVHTSGSAEEAKDFLGTRRDYHPDVALLDVRLPGQWGDRFARYLKIRSPHTRIIFITGEDRVDAIEELGEDTALLPKPLDFPQLLEKLGHPQSAACAAR